MKIGWLIFTCTLLCLGCLRLDDSLFNPNNQLTRYELRDFKGEITVIVPDSMKLERELNQLFTLRSGTSESPETIFALYLGDTTDLSDQRIFLYFHGNAGYLDFYYSRATLLANIESRGNFGVLMIDYQGYGLSSGQASIPALLQDAEASMQWLLSKGARQENIISYGFSLGSIPAIEVAGRYDVAQLILEAPIGSVGAMVQDGSGLSLAPAFFTDITMDNRERIKEVDAPLFWIHGIDDTFLALKTHGQPVYDAHKGSRKLAHIPEAGHGDIPTVWGFESYLNEIEQFVNE